MTIVADPTQPRQITLTQATFNLSELQQALPSTSTSNNNQHVRLDSVKRQNTLLKKVGVGMGRDKASGGKKEGKSRVSDKIKKRMSMRYVMFLITQLHQVSYGTVHMSRAMRRKDSKNLRLP